MELRLNLHHWKRREPDWTAAVVAGFAAGAILMVLELIWAAFFTGSEGPWRISQLAAALTLGTTHYMLGVAFGIVLSHILAGFRYDTSVAAMLLIGAVCGVLLYLVNFHGLTQVFPWFIELRGWTTLGAHLVLSISTALLYWKLARRRVDSQGGP
jgi:hypothetical protein